MTKTSSEVQQKGDRIIKTTTTEGKTSLELYKNIFTKIINSFIKCNKIKSNHKNYVINLVIFFCSVLFDTHIKIIQLLQNQQCSHRRKYRHLKSFDSLIAKIPSQSEYENYL